MNILISGACGVTSRAIARSLKLSERFADARLIGTDICKNRYGLYEGLFEKIYRVLHVNQDGYESSIAKICTDESIDAAIIIPELEVRFWSGREFPVPTILPPPAFCELAVSKRRLYETLAGTGLVPEFSIVSRSAILDGNAKTVGYPIWVRDYNEGSTSGKGAFMAESAEKLRAWMAVNPSSDSLMTAEVLPGRNFACHLLYNNGEIVRTATYERLTYFMSHIAASGITGNICEGRLVNEPDVFDVSVAAVKKLAGTVGETMHGLVAVDLRGASDGRPMITEINLRHVASTYSFAAAGFNLAAFQTALALDGSLEPGEREMQFPPGNMILRDIDGLPLWVADFREPEIGEAISAS